MSLKQKNVKLRKRIRFSSIILPNSARNDSKFMVKLTPDYCINMWKISLKFTNLIYQSSNMYTQNVTHFAIGCFLRRVIFPFERYTV